jgi:hypothetical protein
MAEHAMAQPQQMRPDMDESDVDADEEFGRMRDMLQARISEFAEEHELPIGALSPLLLDVMDEETGLDAADEATTRKP